MEKNNNKINLQNAQMRGVLNNKGFTLIELLVVIVILAIVALITTPIVLDVIESTTDKANRSSAYGIMETAKLYRIEEMFKDRSVPINSNILSTLKIKGSKPKDGDVRVNSSGYIAIALKYGNKCYKKDYEDEDITVEEYTEEECIIPLPPKSIFDEAKGVNKPQLTEGMIPIKWVSNDWINTTEDDSEWYDYNDKKWANAKTADGSFWVWIPRYAYKMSGGYHSNTASSFDIKFLKGQTNEPIDSTVIETSGYNADTKNTLNNYFLHPAFQNNMNKHGFWVAKFEPSGTSNNIKIVPNVFSLRFMTIGDQFNTALDMKNKSAYGWNSSKVDTHMMTNYEWGAVTYLTHSIYGKNAEVWRNPARDYRTGCAGASVNESYSEGCSYSYNSTNGQKASTTGNTYGIYDMSGGTWEYVSAYVNNGVPGLITYESSIINADVKYKNVYTKGATDDKPTNYIENKNIYGDAIWETSNCGNGTNCSWYGDTSSMPETSSPFFARGGGYMPTSTSGLFDFYFHNGSAHNYFSFRPIVSIK